jgi:hypothetical protein
LPRRLLLFAKKTKEKKLEKVNVGISQKRRSTRPGQPGHLLMVLEQSFTKKKLYRQEILYNSKTLKLNIPMAHGKSCLTTRQLFSK